MTALKKAPRIIIIDALRGFSLAGVALVHMMERYVAGPRPQILEGLDSTPDMVVGGIIGFLCSGKFFSLFSILFGLSFFIQMDSAAKRGNDFSMRFLWRGILLFGIGYVHQLFYRGDILTIYALLVPLLIPFHKVSAKWLLGIAAVIFLGLPRFISFAVFGNEALFGLPDGFDNPLETAYAELLLSGPFSELAVQNAVYGMKAKMNFQLLYFGRFYYTFGYFLIGLWLGKIGLFRQLPHYLPMLKKVLKWSAIACLPIFGLIAGTFATAPQPVDFSSWQHIIAFNFMDWLNIAMTAIIGCLFIIGYQKEKWEKRLLFFAPYGRMALTNYVLQSIIGGFLLFGWGLGLITELRAIYLFFLALVMIVLQTLFSKYWLENFKYGPLEWLWRCGTYLKWQPFLKRDKDIL